MYADNVALPAFSCRMPLLLSAGSAAFDRYLLPAGPAAANLLWAHDGTDRQVDRQTDTVLLHTD